MDENVARISKIDDNKEYFTETEERENTKRTYSNFFINSAANYMESVNILV
jgi:hypothetical protein